MKYKFDDKTHFDLDYCCVVSLDTTNNKIFIYSNKKIINFEKFKKNCDRLDPSFNSYSSADSIIIKEKVLYVVEFKSGKYDNISTNDVKKQFIDTKKILHHFFDLNDNQFKCILVVERFLYSFSENIKKLYSDGVHSLKCRFDIIKSCIVPNEFSGASLIQKDDFLTMFNIKLCDCNNKCANQPIEIKFCKFCK